MTNDKVHIGIKTLPFSAESLTKNSWLVLLHVKRIPPHAGIIVNGNYNSLTLKGHELNVNIEALLKIISQKKIESVFIKLKKHPVFSLNYQLELFQELVKNFDRVEPFEATCLKPVKLFFQEFYALNYIDEELLYDFIQRLNENNYLTNASSINVNLLNDSVVLPTYSLQQLNEKIELERLLYKLD